MLIPRLPISDRILRLSLLKRRYEFSEADAACALLAIDSWVEGAAHGAQHISPEKVKHRQHSDIVYQPFSSILPQLVMWLLRFTLWCTYTSFLISTCTIWRDIWRIALVTNCSLSGHSFSRPHYPIERFLVLFTCG